MPLAVFEFFTGWVSISMSIRKDCARELGCASVLLKNFSVGDEHWHKGSRTCSSWANLTSFQKKIRKGWVSKIAV